MAEDKSCIYYFFDGVCGPKPSPDNMNLAKCDRQEGCGYDMRPLPIHLKMNSEKEK